LKEEEDRHKVAGGDHSKGGAGSAGQVQKEDHNKIKQDNH